jgi:hypothetical protein
MQQRLTDIERTLLSAYFDGELSGVDMQRAEELLARSQAAQAYVRDLRNLNSLSAVAFPATAVTTAAGTSAAAKLSSSAIRAAAQNAAATKGLLAGGWGMAGMATAAVAVVAVAVMTLMPSSEPTQPTHELNRPATPLEQMAMHTSSMALDTASLIVPPMTSDELVSFAMNGTLPLDEKRQRYICIADTAAAAPALHTELPAMLRQELGTLDPAALKGLDSIKGVVRTSLLNYSDDRIAIRNDMGVLRLSVLQHIESSLSPRLPAETRQRLMVAREAIASAREIDRQAQDIKQQVRTMEEGVRYVLLPERTITASTSAGTMVRLSPQEYSSPSGQGQMVVIGNNSLYELRDKMQRAPAMAATVAPRAMYTTATVSAGAGGPRGRSTIRVVNMQSPPKLLPALIEDDTSTFYDPRDHMRPPTPPRSNRQMLLNDGGTTFSIDEKDMDRLLNGVQKSLDRADSIMKQVEIQVKRKEKKPKSGACEDCSDSDNPNEDNE